MGAVEERRALERLSESYRKLITGGRTTPSPPPLPEGQPPQGSPPQSPPAPQRTP
jgi:hypothetical protein